MSKFNEEEHPRNSEGEFMSKDIQELSAEELKQKILSEQEAEEDNAETYSDELKILLGTEYKGFKGQAAIDKLMREKQGHVKGAFHRDDIGDIDLFWGNENVGLQHILLRRQEQGIDATKFLKDITDVVERGKCLKKNKEGNFEFWSNGKSAVIAPEYHGNRITYLLTAYRRTINKKKTPQ